MGRYYQLAPGHRVRLRMVQPRDSSAIRAFLAEQGLGIDELDLARLLRFDPRRRAVICASALVNAQELVIGLGAIDLDASSPDLVLIGREHAEDLREMLTAALCGRARAQAV